MSSFVGGLSAFYAGGASAVQVVPINANAAANNSYWFPFKTTAAVTITSIVDSRGNSWGWVSATNTSFRSHQAYCLAPASPLRSGDTVTVTLSGTTGLIGAVGEILPMPAVDTSTSDASASAESSTSLAVTTTQDADFLLAAIAFQNNSTGSVACTGYTLTVTGGAATVAAGYKDAAAAGVETAAWSWTGSVTHSETLLALKTVVYAAVSLSSTSSLSPGGSVTEPAAVSLTAASSLATVGADQENAAAALTSASSLTAAGAGATSGAASLGSVSTLTGAAAGGRIVDTFNRADSSTSLGTASDGGTWTVVSGTFGISSNQAYRPTNGAGTYDGSHDVAWRDLGSATVDLTVISTRYSSLGDSILVFAGASDKTHYALRYNGASLSVVERVDASGTAVETVISHCTFSGWSGGGTATLRVTYDASSGDINVYQNGSLAGSGTSSSPLTGTRVGFGAATFTSADEHWDDFNASPSLPQTLSAAAALSSTSSLAAAGLVTEPGAATLTSTSTLATAGGVTDVAAAALASTATLTASGSDKENAAAALTAASTLTAAATAATTGAASLTSTSTLTSRGTARPAGRAINEHGRFIIGTVDETGRHVLTPQTDVVGLHRKVAPVVGLTVLSAASLSSTSTLSTTAAVGVTGATALTSTSSLTAAGTDTEQATTNLDATSTLTAGAFIVGQNSADLTAASTLTPTGTATEPGSATLTATAALTAGARVDVEAAAALTSTSAFTTVGLDQITAAANLQALSTLTAIGAAAGSGSATLLSLSVLGADSDVTIAAAAQLTATSTFLAAGTIPRPVRDITIVGAYPGARFAGAFPGARFVGTVGG